MSNYNNWIIQFILTRESGGNNICKIEHNCHINQDTRRRNMNKEVNMKVQQLFMCAGPALVR